MTTIAERITWLLALLRDAIAVHLDREARLPPHARPTAPAPIPAPIWVLLHHRLARLARRFEALFHRWQSGTLPRPRPRPSPGRTHTRAPRPAPNPARPATPAPLRLPRAFGWANRRLPEAAPPTGYLEDLLHNRAAEMRAFVQAAPQAGRLLRPLCQALGLRPPAWLRLPPRPRRPRPRKPRPEPRLSLTDPSLRLPPYVVATARAWKKKDR